LRELTPGEVRALLAERPGELVAVWPDASGERLDVIVPRHLERAGFRFVAEDDESGRLAGIAYGYRGEAGQWWHDTVSAAMDEAARSRWLGPDHFELVELAVRPDLRLRGLGGRLHDALLAGLDAPAAVLSTEVDNEPAIALYRGRGWEVVVPQIDFGPDFPPFLVMGKHLTF
jgi:ribosomal protein S18 acetylase RimI-like enzyme